MCVVLRLVRWLKRKHLNIGNVYYSTLLQKSQYVGRYNRGSKSALLVAGRRNKFKGC